MNPETKEIRDLEVRVERLENAERRNRKISLAWYLGGTILFFILIYVIADLGSGLLKVLEQM